ncbi:MAG: hypothetical protein HY223_00165 [Thaumarchaeota archaeon]|nr:hypothetical protein [Nitrososphaerota archaeon]
MPVINAVTLSPLLNNFKIKNDGTKTIVVSKASEIKSLMLKEITVNGKLLDKRYVRFDTNTHKRTVVKPKSTKYSIETGDGDIHFCLGYSDLQPHIACELQNAKKMLSDFNKSIGNSISVTGFLRCMFEHPGFKEKDDVHIFEIHPVRVVNLDGQPRASDVDKPKQDAINTWLKPWDLNKRDKNTNVVHDDKKDTLTFTGMAGMDENYVRVEGTVSQIDLNSNMNKLASFTFDSPDIKHSVDVYCLPETTAERELGQLKNNQKVSLIALRNIDYEQAFHNTYAINLLAISFE